MRKTKGHGFIADEIKPEDYVFGGFTKIQAEVLQPDGQWDAFLPSDEMQKRNGLETSNCTVYGTLNCIETILERRYGIPVDFSERFIGVLAETTPAGNSPHKAAEAIRMNGLIPETTLPFDESINLWEEYYNPDPMSGDLISMGKEWKNDFEFKHDWVPVQGDPEIQWNIITNALQYSPLGVSVYAWREGVTTEDWGTIYVEEDRDNDNHWCELYGSIDTGDVRFYKVFDTYDNTHKTLAWDFTFSFAKRYHIKKKPRINHSWWFVDIFDGLIYGR